MKRIALNRLRLRVGLKKLKKLKKLNKPFALIYIMRAIGGYDGM
jgi:hypothetical protein